MGGRAIPCGRAISSVLPLTGSSLEGLRAKIQQVLLATCIHGAEQNTAGRTQVRTVPVIMTETAVSREGSEQQRRAATICIYVTVDTR